MNNIFSWWTVKFLQPYNKVYMGQQLNTVLGAQSPFVKVLPPPLVAQRAPASTDTDYAIGFQWFDEPNTNMYTHIGGGTWDLGGNETATTSQAGIVTLFAPTSGVAPLDWNNADNTTVTRALDVKNYVDGTASAGAANASETVKGLVEISTNAEAVAGTGTGATGAVLAVTPTNLSAIFAAAPAIGGTTPAAGTFTTLDATGAIDFDVGGTWDSAGTAISIGNAADTDAINVGTGAAARTITVGNTTGATAVAINTGTGHFTVTTTSTGDIILNSDDTMLLDADGVLELNSSAGVIGIGNDADAQNINIGTGAAARTITVGNSTGATSVVLNAGTGAVDIGANAVAHTVTIGNTTGATAIIENVGTGNYALDGVGGSTYAIGASTTTGTITIGGTAQTGTFGVGVSSGIMTMNLLTGNG